MWVDLTLWDFRSHVGLGDFKQLVSWIVEEEKQLELFVFTVWSIWHQRNLVWVQASAIVLHQVAEVARNSLADYHSRLSDTEVQVEPHSRRLQINWLPPTVIVAKINFDGAVFLKENNSGIGMVVGNENGLVLGSCTKSLA